MRLGLRAKEAGAITLAILLVVVTASLVHFMQMSRLVVEEAKQHAELLAQQIYGQTRGALSRSGKAPSADALRRDANLRSLVDASVGYCPHLLYALISDPTARILLHSERAKEGSIVPRRPAFTELARRGPVRRVASLYGGVPVYEVAIPLELQGRPFGHIRLGVSTALVRRELTTFLGRSAGVAVLALPVAWVAAMGLGSLLLRPVRRLTREVDGLREGRFPMLQEWSGSDEIGRLAVQLQCLGHQIESDRNKLVSEAAQMQRVVDHLEYGVILLSRERRLLFVNRVGTLILGPSSEQAVGRRVEEITEPAHPLRLLLERFPDGEGEVAHVTLQLDDQGRVRELLVSLVPLGGTEDRMGTMVLLRDLEPLRALRSVLSQSVQLAGLGDLTSGIAHEVKNPMNAVVIHAGILEGKLQGAPADVQQALDVIKSEIRRLDTVVQGFLRLVRPQRLSLKLVDLDAVLRDAIALLEAEWQTAGVRFVIRSEASLPPILADAELLHQVFMNILLNACQAMPAGGDVRVEIRQPGRGGVEVTVGDEGTGIPPDDLDKVFRLHYTTKPHGNGIGLPLAYRIVKMHDGAIDVRSEVGRGTTVIVTLPVDGFRDAIPRGE